MILLKRETTIVNNGSKTENVKEVNLVLHSFEELKAHKKEILKKLNKKEKKYTEKNIDFVYIEKEKV